MAFLVRPRRNHGAKASSTPFQKSVTPLSADLPHHV
jgi:hypothetical protein